MSKNQPIDLLANYIVAEVPGAPNGTDEDEDVCSCAMRLLKEYRSALEEIVKVLEVPGGGYPPFVGTVHEIARRALSGKLV